MINHLQFVTDPLEDGILRILLYTCGADWLPIGEPQRSGDIRTEEDYHRNLRIEATKQGHYVKEFSTDPQWNPDYIEEEKVDDTPQASPEET
jgi:hypothetical protein